MAIQKKKQFVWKRKHLLGLRNLRVEEIEHILDTAEGFEQISTRSIKKAPTLRGKVVVNLFFEDRKKLSIWSGTSGKHHCISFNCLVFALLVDDYDTVSGDFLVLYTGQNGDFFSSGQAVQEWFPDGTVHFQS